MISKNKILIFSGIGSAMMVIFMNSTQLNICDKAAYDCRLNFDLWEHVFYFFPFILLFSLITYKLRENAFQAWWKFARIAIPVIFMASLYINLSSNPNGGGWFSLDEQIKLIEHGILYAVFVIGSLIQIYRGYKTK